MKASSGSLSPILERHTPQHPLPEEIQNMESEETVCQFCGVSYLIHHEMKKLEDQVKTLEKELAQCKASQENEKTLRIELKKAKDGFQSQQSMLEEKCSTITKMTSVIGGQKTKIEELRDSNTKIGCQVASLKVSFRSYKEMVLCRAQSIITDLKAAMVELKSFKSIIEPMRSEFTAHTVRLQKDIKRVSSMYNSENIGMRQEVRALQEELFSKVENEDLLRNTISMMQTELNTASKTKDEMCNEYREENEKLQSHVSSLQSRTTELLHDVATLQSQIGISKSDFAQSKDQLSKKQQDLQSTLQKLHRTEKNAEITIQRMNQEIKHLQQDLTILNKEKQKWKATEENLMKQREELSLQISTRSGEGKQLWDSLKEARRELIALKSEREKMVMAHQSQITQLRESFREKLNAADENPKMIEERLENQRLIHGKEMMELETHLKENHDIEIALEREKHDEERRTYIQNYKELTEQSESDANRSKQHFINESRSLQRQMSAMKSDHSQQIMHHEDEKSSLKRLVSQLEERITKLTVEQEGVTMGSLAKLREIKQKLMEVNNEKTHIEKENSMLKEEITVLQETVRKECEERFELTDALSTIREQLRKAKADLPLLRTPVSAINGVSPNDALHSTRLSSKTLQCLEGNNHADGSEYALPDALPVQVRRNSLGPQTANNCDSPHVKDIAFVSQPSPPLGKSQARANSQQSVESVRRRIAAVIKRK